ncbi:MAG: M18 family aminopeptidase [Halanaerobiaceae bacterium]
MTNKQKTKQSAEQFLDYINNSPTPYQAVKQSEKILAAKNYQKLDLGEKWNLKKGGKYYLLKDGSSLIAFAVGSGKINRGGFRIIGAHTDSPGFRIKPNPEMVENDSYLKINTEVYGGPIVRTWLDRPLSLAGRIFLKGDNPFCPREKLVDIQQPLMTIPSLSIHLNRDVNQGQKLNKQDHMLPLLSLVEENFNKDNYLVKYLAEHLNIEPEKIIDFDLFLYENEESKLIGAHNEFISSGRMDDQAMAHAALQALINSQANNSINVTCLFDSEEIGSKTSQGADSPFIKNILHRIHNNFSTEQNDYFAFLENSFLISADMAHALHPNKADASDPTNRPILNQGPVIKNVSGSYITEGKSSSIYQEICKSANVPYQRFANRSDKKSGKTIGPIMATQLSIKAIDVGNPLLAMHSIRELGGVKDHHYIIKSFQKFFSLQI